MRVLTLNNEPPCPIPPEEDTFPHEEIARTKRRSWILQYARIGGVGAEFGIFRGHFAAEIADCLKPEKLYLVDVWRKAGVLFNWGNIPYTNHNRLTTAQALADARHRLEPFRDQPTIKFVEESTAEFCRQLDHSLDFAYLDTNHRYEAVLSDLEVVSDVIDENGVIMGDDWWSDVGHEHHGVMRAVNDFIRERAYQIVAAGPDGQWCIRRTPRYLARL